MYEIFIISTGVREFADLPARANVHVPTVKSPLPAYKPDVYELNTHRTNSKFNTHYN